jgi:hypothetical protein
MVLPVQGNLIKDGTLAHFGRLSLDATRSRTPFGAGTNFSWEWEPDQKSVHLPAGLRKLGKQSGVWDPFHNAQDSINLDLRYEKNRDEAFLRLVGGAELLDGSVPVVPNTAAGIRSRVGQPAQSGGLPVPMPVTNGMIHYNGKWYEIMWILTHRELATNR